MEGYPPTTWTYCPVSDWANELSSLITIDWIHSCVILRVKCKGEVNGIVQRKKTESYCDWLAPAWFPLASMVAVSSPATVVHQPALWEITRSSSFYHRVFQQSDEFHFAIFWWLKAHFNQITKIYQWYLLLLFEACMQAWRVIQNFPLKVIN